MSRSSGRWLGVACLLAACGGHAEHDVELGGGGGGGAPVSETAGESGDADAGAAPDANAGGASAGSGDESAGAGDDTSEAGAADVPYDSLIRSGTRGCENSDYCFGLSCYAPPPFTPTVCVAPCKSDASCEPDEACIRAPQLAPTCYARCKSPEDCYQGFDCFDFSGAGELICFPEPWALDRDKLGY